MRLSRTMVCACVCVCACVPMCVCVCVFVSVCSLPLQCGGGDVSGSDSELK